MIWTGFLLAVLLSCCSAAESENSNEVPFVIASQGGSSGPQISNLLPEIESRGRSDIEIEEDQPPRGYFYPKPAKPFNLPEFKPLGADEPLLGSAYLAEEDNAQVERLPRSPRRRPPQYDPIPPFIPGFIPPGFIPPNNIRPLPALYGRPGRY